MVDVKDELIGKKIGTYEVTALIGVGGMARVYLGEQPVIGREVAIKVLRQDLAENEAMSRRFTSEASAAARLRHPSIVEVFDFHTLEDGRPCYVMERLEGRELKEVMRERGKMSPEEVMRYLEPLCAALQAAHDQKVVHRDLKPANIFVMQEDPVQLKLLDFGIAKVLEDSDGLQTATGQIVGTPHFISPEQAAAKKDLIGPASDIYSLGIIIYWMLCGKLPFHGESAGMLLVKQIQEPPPPLAERAPEVPPSVAAVVQRCLEKAPSIRLQSPTALLEAFRKAVAGELLEEDLNAAAGDPGRPADQATAVLDSVEQSVAPETADADTQMLHREKASDEPATVEQTGIGSISDIFDSAPSEPVAGSGDAPDDVDMAGGMTTMSRATGQVTAERDRPSGAQGKIPLFATVIVALALVIVGGGYWAFSGDADTVEEKPAHVAGDSPSPGPVLPAKDPTPVVAAVDQGRDRTATLPDAGAPDRPREESTPDAAPARTSNRPPAGAARRPPPTPKSKPRRARKSRPRKPTSRPAPSSSPKPKPAAPKRAGEDVFDVEL